MPPSYNQFEGDVYPQEPFSYQDSYRENKGAEEKMSYTTLFIYTLRKQKEYFEGFKMVSYFINVEKTMQEEPVKIKSVM